METQQILEILAKLKAIMDANQAEIKADRKTNQARMEANKEDMPAKISASMKSNQDLLARLEARIETNREKDREDLKGMTEEMKAKAGGKQEDMLARMREDIKSSQAEMKSTVCAIRSILEETIKQELKDFLLYVNQETQNLHRELTETIGITQVELQGVELPLDKRIRDVEEKILSIKEYITSNDRKL
jgi:hypothetical protein